MSIYFYLQSDSSGEEEEEEKKKSNSFSLRWKLQIQKQALGIWQLCGGVVTPPTKPHALHLDRVNLMKILLDWK